jgi:hypothetical protein
MARNGSLRAHVGRSLPLAALAAGLALLTWAVLVALPPYFAPRNAFPTAGEAVTAQNDVRATLLQAAGALVLLLSAGLGAWFTGRQLQLNRQGQITERFTRAVDQLGSPHLDVRLGGIYALERIARDSTPDRPTIAEILCAYVREHAPWPPSRPGQYVAAAPLDALPPMQTRAPDVQAILTVLGRGAFPAQMDLNHADLRRANLNGARLHGARLRGAHLERANLHGADLQDALLSGAHLERANLQSAHLERALLRDAHLHDSILYRAHLQAANLRGARLERANLRGAHLRSSVLRGAYLKDAIANSTTAWPAALDPVSAGVLLIGEEEDQPSLSPTGPQESV